MKTKYLLGLLLILLLSVSCKNNLEMKGTFLFNPEQPKAGEEITIKYNPVNTELGTSENINAVVYSYSTDIDEAKEIYLNKKGGLWTGKFIPNSETRGLFLIFKSGETRDNNNENGYNIKLYKDGKVVTGALAGLAVLHKRYARLIGFKGDAELAKLLLKEEFKTNPSIKPEYLETYFLSLPRSTRDSVVRIELEALELSHEMTENKLELLAKYFPMTGDVVKGEKYAEMLADKFPESKFVQQIIYNKFREEKTIEKQIALLNQTIKKQPNGKNAKRMLSNIISGLGKTNKFKNAERLIEQYPELVSSNLFNSIAWQMYVSKTKMNTAVGLAKKGVEIARKEVENNDEKPKFYTDTQWIKSKQMSLAGILDTFGNLLRATNQKEKALTVFKEAVQITNEEIPEINEGYAILLVELGKQEKAKEVLQKYINSGKSTDKMKSLYTQVFVELGGSDAELNKYLSKNNEDVNKKIIEKLKKELMNKPAPQFSLVDVEGKTVSLSDFKGKTVVLDFWATWCAPCIKSFPAMQKAQEKLSNKNEVKFLFINTREQAEDKSKNVKDFLKKTNYPFHILLDEKSEVLAEYEVPGIPTKFVIDKNGNIRFKSVGFNGNAEELVFELEQMISMIK